MASHSRFESQSLDDWLFYLESQHHKEIDLGLERTISVAKQAHVLDMANAKVALVAGTNGKGTTIRFMELYLLAQGYRVGVFGSPHMFTYHERVRINGEMLSDDAHIEAFRHIESTRHSTPLTYFEFGTLAAFYLLQQAKLDYVLIEVGLGGRLDATNILDHDIAVITSLGLDHTDWLGDSIEKIGFEKAGIFRANKPAIIGLTDAPETVFEQANDIRVSDVVEAGKDYRVDSMAEHWNYISAGAQLNGLPLSLIPVQNVGTAIATLNRLGVELSEELVSKTITELALPGRMQILSESPMSMVDVAHNPHAVGYLMATLSRHRKFSKFDKIDVVVAMMKDKDIGETLSLISDRVATWHIAPLQNNPRAASVEEMEYQLTELNQSSIEKYDSIVEAWRAARVKQSPETLLLGFGSFYTVAEILRSAE